MKSKLVQVLLVLFIVSNAYAGVTVSGKVLNALNQPIPGVTVSLFHPKRGRSEPAITDRYGQYIFYEVPTDNSSYFIEVYWGKKLIYRNAIQVKAALQWPIQIK